MTHSILLGGIPLDLGQPWRWTFRPGTRPTVEDFLVDVSREAEFRTLLGQPTELQIAYETNGVLRQHTISGLYVVDIERTTDGLHHFSRIRVADFRYRWQGKLMPIPWINWMRRLNDVDVIRSGDDIRVPGQVLPVDPETLKPDPIGGFAPLLDENGFRPANVVAEYFRVPTFAYNKFSRDRRDSEDGVSWTAIELLRFLLRGGVQATSQGNKDVAGLITDGQVLHELNPEQFSDHPVPRSNWFGVMTTNVIDRLLILARARLWAGHDGNVWLGPTDLREAPQLPPDDQRLQDTEEPYMQDRRAYRARQFVTVLRKEEETPFAAVTETDTITTENIMTPCVRLPRNMTLDIGDGEREYGAGTFVPRDKFLANRFTGVTYAEIVRQYFRDWQLAMLLKKGIQRGQEQPTDLQDLAALAESVPNRQWLIDRDFMERVASISTESVTVLESISGKRMPNPVWMQYGLVYTGRDSEGTPLAHTKYPLWRNVDYDLRTPHA